MFDLDELKQFNDKYGHVEGDHLIIHFASLLRAHTRADDVLVRLGRREFLVVMRQMRSLDDALKRGQTSVMPFTGAAMPIWIQRRALPASRSGTTKSQYRKSFGGPMKHCTLQKTAAGASACHGREQNEC